MAITLAQRQRHYVSRLIQGTLLRQFATDWLISYLLLWHGLFLWSFCGGSQSSQLTDASWTLGGCYLAFCKSHVRLAVCAILVFPVFLWNAFRLSHRIAGPLERFRDTLEALRSGKTPKSLTLRRDDLLLDLQRAFNRYLAHVESETRPRGVLPKTTQIDEDSVLEPITNPLLRELEVIKAEIQKAAGNSSFDES